MTKPADPMSYAITWSYVVVDDFLPIDLANAMRAEIEAHFGDPDHHQPKTHQIWNYWYVPGAYTYLRTAPENVIDRARVEAFAERLKKWSIHEFGIGNATWPYLSLYTNGCSQTLHNDSLNGRFGYVYSLTKPDRKTIGGETIIVSDGDPFRQNLQKSTALAGFSNAIEPRFNRLVVFDDRVIHGVERVAGSMDPVEGRFVLHGHIKDQGPIVTGALSKEQVEPLLRAFHDQFMTDNRAEVGLFTGLLTFKVDIGPDGAVVELQVYFDRVTHLAHEHADLWPRLRDRCLAALSGLRFPAAAKRTTVLLPIVFAGKEA